MFSKQSKNSLNHFFNNVTYIELLENCILNMTKLNAGGQSSGEIIFRSQDDLSSESSESDTERSMTSQNQTLTSLFYATGINVL